MFKRLGEHIDAVMERDPAPRSRLEVVLCYPGFHALVFYHLANAAWRRKWHLLGRFIATLGRAWTAIDIHPGATIGRRFFIDHGAGVVVGETAEIGDNVTLYQGVTLGGTSPAVNSAAQVNVKRHPTLADNVIISSGAQVLGPITVGAGARVGANAVVVRDVPPGVTVVGIPARIVARRRPSPKLEETFCAYGVSEDLPDPVAGALEGLLERVEKLTARVAELEGRGQVNGAVVERPEGGVAGERLPTERDVDVIGGRSQVS